MSIWEDLGSIIGQVQSVSSDLVNEMNSDAKDIESTISSASEEIQNSAVAAKDTITDVVQNIEQDLNLKKSSE